MQVAPWASGNTLGWVETDGTNCRFYSWPSKALTATVPFHAVFPRAAALGDVQCTIGQGSGDAPALTSLPVITNKGAAIHLPGPALGGNPVWVNADQVANQFVVYWMGVVGGKEVVRMARLDPDLASAPVVEVLDVVPVGGTSQGFGCVDPDGTIHWTDKERQRVVGGLTFTVPMTVGRWTAGQHGWAILGYDSVASAMKQIVANADTNLNPLIAVADDGSCLAAISSNPSQVKHSSEFTPFIATPNAFVPAFAPTPMDWLSLDDPKYGDRFVFVDSDPGKHKLPDGKTFDAAGYAAYCQAAIDAAIAQKKTLDVYSDFTGEWRDHSDNLYHLAASKGASVRRLVSAYPKRLDVTTMEAVDVTLARLTVLYTTTPFAPVMPFYCQNNGVADNWDLDTVLRLEQAEWDWLRSIGATQGSDFGLTRMTSMPHPELHTAHDALLAACLEVQHVEIGTVTFSYAPVSGQSPVTVNAVATITGDVKYLNWLWRKQGGTWSSALVPATTLTHAFVFVDANFYEIKLQGLGSSNNVLNETGLIRTVTVSAAPVGSYTPQQAAADLRVIANKLDGGQP